MLSYRNIVMKLQQETVRSVTADQCGALSVWASGLLVGRINRDQKLGSAANHRVRLAELCFVCWIFVKL